MSSLIHHTDSASTTTLKVCDARKCHKPNNDGADTH